MGTNLLHNGRAQEAAAAYDRARVIGLPYRMMWYQFGAFQAYYEVGRYDEVIALADATIRVTSDVEELHYWRALALEAQGDLDGARAALRTALEKKPNYEAARVALARLERIASHGEPRTASGAQHPARRGLLRAGGGGRRCCATWSSPGSLASAASWTSTMPPLSCPSSCSPSWRAARWPRRSSRS